MIDHQDKQTQPLPLDEQPAKRSRGRPGTGKALSNAERQRLYRERQKAQRNDQELHDLRARAELAEAKCDVLHHELAMMKAKLSKAMERKVKRHRDDPPRPLKIEDGPTEGL